jgi:hypothetical protein
MAGLLEQAARAGPGTPRHGRRGQPPGTPTGTPPTTPTRQLHASGHVCPASAHLPGDPRPAPRAPAGSSTPRTSRLRERLAKLETHGRVEPPPACGVAHSVGELDELKLQHVRPLFFGQVEVRPAVQLHLVAPDDSRRFEKKGGTRRLWAGPHPRSHQAPIGVDRAAVEAELAGALPGLPAEVSAALSDFHRNKVYSNEVLRRAAGGGGACPQCAPR